MEDVDISQLKNLMDMLTSGDSETIDLAISICDTIPEINNHLHDRFYFPGLTNLKGLPITYQLEEIKRDCTIHFMRKNWAYMFVYYHIIKNILKRWEIFSLFSRMRDRINTYFNMLLSSDEEQAQLAISLLETDDDLLMFLQTYLPSDYSKLNENIQDAKKHFNGSLTAVLSKMSILLLAMELNTILYNLHFTYKNEK